MNEREILKEKILEALKESKFSEIASELIESAYPMYDMENRQCGQMDGILVYDTEDDKLKVISEGRGTWTPSYVYLLRIDANEDYEEFTEEEMEDYWLCVYESLGDMYDDVKTGKIFEGQHG